MAAFRPPRGSEGLSVASLASRDGASVCSSMRSSPRSRYGPDETIPRRFSSRHVPQAAEEIARRSEHLSCMEAGQLNGLVKYLKPNSEWEEQQKQALVSDIEVLVPEEYDEALRGEFERRCAFGERLNTELMSSSKWIKLLKEVDAVAEGGHSRRRSAAGGQRRLLSHAEADIVYHKVMHNCDHGGKRLTFDLFCKALYLAAQSIRPDLDGEAALADLVARVVAAAPAEAQEEDWSECLIESGVVMVLDQFKPALHDLHGTFCKHGLDGPEKACRGRGAVRLRERSFWSQSQGPQGSQGLSGYTGVSRASRLSLRSGAPALPLTPVPDEDEAAGYPAAGAEVVKGSLPEFSALASGGPLGGLRLGGLPTLLEGGSKESSPKHAQSRTMTMTELGGATITSRATSVATLGDPYTYVNGAPVPRNRQTMMSLDQWLALSRQFDIMPEFMSRLECAKIFKRAQLSGQASSHGGSAHGYLNQEAFVEAFGVLALQAYAKEPYCAQYPASHEKIHAFLLRILPVNSKVLHERFGGQRLPLPGCAEVPNFVRPA